MKRLLPFLSVVLLVACSGGKNAETTEAAAEVPAAANVSPAPEVDAMIKTAEMALKQKNEVEAAATLQSLRATPTLTVDQKLSVQDMIAQAQAKLAERASQGDPQAQAAMRMLQMNPR